MRKEMYSPDFEFSTPYLAGSLAAFGQRPGYAEPTANPLADENEPTSKAQPSQLPPPQVRGEQEIGIELYRRRDDECVRQPESCVTGAQHRGSACDLAICTRDGDRHGIEASISSSNDLGASLRGSHQDFRVRRSREHQGVTPFASFKQGIDGWLVMRVPCIEASNDNAGVQNR